MTGPETTTKPIAGTERSVCQSFLAGRRFRPFTRFGLVAAVLSLIFIQPLWQWMLLAVRSDLHSHVVLMPVISGYLIWIKRKELPAAWSPALIPAAVCVSLGILVLAMGWTATLSGREFRGTDRLTVPLLAFYLFLLAAGWAFWGKNLVKALIFPLGMLAFMIPLPGFMVAGLETFLKHASADVSHLLFTISGMPVFREKLVFILPGLAIEVAQECSGIRSTIVLLITSLLAGYMYLRSPWKRAALVIATVPLGIVRNAIRIFVIAKLTVDVDPTIIHSPLHTRGGPIFFILSLVPLAALLIMMRRSESRSHI